MTEDIKKNRICDSISRNTGILSSTQMQSLSVGKQMSFYKKGRLFWIGWATSNFAVTSKGVVTWNVPVEMTTLEPDILNDAEHFIGDWGVLKTKVQRVFSAIRRIP